MPTQILYDQLLPILGYSKHDPNRPLSFFETYNPHALANMGIGVIKPQLNGDQKRELCEEDLLCRPDQWARDVFEGICRTEKKGKELLTEVCKFLYDASFYGFSLENLCDGTLDKVASDQNYDSAEKFLMEHYPNMQNAQRDGILAILSVGSYVTAFKVGYNPKTGSVQKRFFVQRRYRPRLKFERAVNIEMQRLEESRATPDIM